MCKTRMDEAYVEDVVRCDEALMYEARVAIYATV